MNKAIAYEFFNNLMLKYPEDSAGMFIDIIVEFIFFPKGDGTEVLSELDQKVADLMVGEPAMKISAIDLVRKELNMTAVEAKNYVESRVWPLVLGPRSEKLTRAQQKYVTDILKRISIGYNIPFVDEETTS